MENSDVINFKNLVNNELKEVEKKLPIKHVKIYKSCKNKEETKESKYKNDKNSFRKKYRNEKKYYNRKRKYKNKEMYPKNTRTTQNSKSKNNKKRTYTKRTDLIQERIKILQLAKKSIEEDECNCICDCLYLIMDNSKFFEIFMTKNNLIQKIYDILINSYKNQNPKKAISIIQLLIKINENLLQRFEVGFTRNTINLTDANEFLYGSSIPQDKSISSQHHDNIEILKKFLLIIFEILEKNEFIFLSDFGTYTPEENGDMISTDFQKYKKIGLKKIKQTEYISTLIDILVNSQGAKYREKKYKINSSSDDYSKYNKVYIKERKLKCGVHNTWCFANTNGLENSVTLTKKDNSLNYIGILTVDHFFVEESLCGFILELDYIVAIPIIENQKEENLTLPIGYSIFIPEDFDESDQFKRTNFITGPTETIYGEKLWYSPDVSDRIIELGFTLSQNQELIVDNYRSIELEKN